MELVLAHISPKPVLNILQDLYLRVIQSEARQEYTYLLSQEQKAVLPVSEWLRRAKNFIQVQLNSTVRGITSTSRKQVKQVLQEALTKGSSVADTSRALREKVTVLSKKRARTIAVSELNAASNYGSLIGAQTSGLRLNKVWLATEDGRTRESHLHANGQSVDVGGHFIVGGEPCEIPGDPALSPAERARCRCTVIYKKKPQAQQPIIDL